MECWYTDEVIEQIDEEIAFFQDLIDRDEKQNPDERFSYAIGILNHMKAKLEKLQVKEFNYQE